MEEKKGNQKEALANLMSTGMTMVLSVAIGLAIGYYLDRWLDTKPWATAIFFMLGCAAGFLNLFRAVNKLK